MRILFLSHNFPPEVNAPATRTFEHCVRWAQEGHRVTVVTSAPHWPLGRLYPGYQNAFHRQVEWIDGIQIIRVWTYLAPNAKVARRIANYLSYMGSAALTSMRIPTPDVIVATSPQFFSGWAGVLVSRLKKVPLVMEIRDMWPDSIRAVGAIQNRLILRFLELLEREMYRSARHIVTLGRGYRARILEKMDGPASISVIPNGVDLARFVPREPDAGLLRLWNLEGRFVCSYVGTIGMAHGLEVVLQAARILKAEGRHDIAFCLVGDGAREKELKRQARQKGIEDRVVFAGQQRKEAIPTILASSSACLIHLRKCSLFESVVPSKMFEIMAMNRPIIIGVRGEAREIVMEAKAGLAMEPESAWSLVRALVSLADNPHLARQLRQRGREYVAENYNRDQLAARFLQILEHVAGKRRGGRDRAVFGERKHMPQLVPALPGGTQSAWPGR